MPFLHPFQHVPMLILTASSSHTPYQHYHPNISYHQPHLLQPIA
jgi:hypothetical protein